MGLEGQKGWARCKGKRGKERTRGAFSRNHMSSSPISCSLFSSLCRKREDRMRERRGRSPPLDSGSLQGALGVGWEGALH